MIIQKTATGKLLCLGLYATHAQMKALELSENFMADLLPTLPDVPGFSFLGGERKFVVEEHEDGALEVFIGPMLCEGFYYHKHIIHALEDGLALAPKSWSIQGRQGKVVGGGEIRWAKKPDGALVLEFRDRSGDFGVFTPKLILYRDDLQRAFSQCAGVPIRVNFSWID